MPDTLLGNQARAGSGGDNESLRSAVCLPCISSKRGATFSEVKFHCQAQTRLGIWPRFLAEFELGRRLSLFFDF